jgi:hypothetical protein
VEKITCAEMIERFDKSVRKKVENLLNKDGTDGMVLFENQDLSSSHIGEKTGVVFGPARTYKTLNALKVGHLGDVPSRFKYSVAYCLKGDL